MRPYNLILLLLVFVPGCRFHTIDRGIADTDPAGWAITDTVTIIYANTDTLGLRDLSVFVRFDTNFRADSLPLVIRVISPDSLWLEDRISGYLHDKHGSGSYAEATIPYRSAALLSEEGDYIFKISPLESVVGIWAIGICSREN